MKTINLSSAEVLYDAAVRDITTSTTDFYDVMDKVQLVALPAAIYDAYQKVLPKRKEKLFEEEEKEKIMKTTDLFAEQEEGGEV